jgi:hypothetical protein
MHSGLDQDGVLSALRDTGEALAVAGFAGEVWIVLAGGVAGLLSGHLAAHRTTGDCDVLDLDREDAWTQINAAAREIARANGLPPTWLNRDCQQFAHCFPLGWRERTEEIARFGPLRVSVVSRFDLMGSKIVSAPKRPQDLSDVMEMKPTPEELNRIEEHLDRVAAEHLDGFDYAPQRGILRALRDQP